jgi:quinol monooxygenase YgiN
MNVVLQVEIEVAKGNEARFTELLMENARAARQEKGCRMFEVLADPQDAAKLMLLEIYDDQAAFEKHQEGEAFKKYLREAVPLVAKRERRFWKRVT